MKNSQFAKTLTASLPGDAQTIFSRICDPENLPSWHSSFCRSMRRENGTLIVETPRGAVPIRFIRNDHILVLDMLIEVTDGIELTNAIRILANGEGSEIVWTLVKPQGLSDAAFHEQLRWAGSALHNLRKERGNTANMEVGKGSSVLKESSDSNAQIPTSDVEPMQAPSPAEVSSMPLSGKKLFIGNLSYDWKDEELRAYFGEAGTVATAEVARFRGRGGRSRGFGFVEMATEAEAQTVIEKLHGAMAGGRQIIVRLAKSQESRPPRIIGSSADAASVSEPIEPGNERMPRIPMGRPRGERPRRGGAPHRAPERSSAPRRLGGGRARPAGTERPYQELDISNKSGYEIFPRRAPGSSGPSPSSSPAPSGPTREASPYMDDTGDIENHGHRPPRHRRRR